MKKSIKLFSGLIVTGFFLVSLAAVHFSGANFSFSRKAFFPRERVHNAHLTGKWYPHDKKKLCTIINDYLGKAREHFPVPVGANDVRACIVPHAGYSYSGLCAASAYCTLLQNGQKNKKIRRVIILAPSHFEQFYGVALPDYRLYRTPLGDCSVDQRAIAYLSRWHIFRTIPKAHKPEHAIEMQLPFLQSVIEDFSIIPLVIGNISPKDYHIIAEKLKYLIDERTFVVVSSDFIHHGPRYSFELYKKNKLDQIRLLDSDALNALCAARSINFDTVLERVKIRARGKEMTICGRTPLRILLKMLEKSFIDQNQLQPRLCSYYTSVHAQKARKNNFSRLSDFFVPIGDDQVKNSVSYAALLFVRQQETLQDQPKENMFTGYEKKSLLHSAYQAVKNELADQHTRRSKKEEHLIWPIRSPGMLLQLGAFVTLNNKNNSLRGCIGRITTDQPLYETVIAMAKAAAFHDQRFAPVTLSEFDDLKFSISVLTKPKKILHYNLIDLSKHGVILTKRNSDDALSRAVYLPSVARDTRWDIITYLRHLSTKAGLPPNAYKQDTHFSVFESLEIKNLEISQKKSKLS